MPTPYPMEFRRDVIAVARQGEQSREQIARSFGISGRVWPAGCGLLTAKTRSLAGSPPPRPGRLEHLRPRNAHRRLAGWQVQLGQLGCITHPCSREPPRSPRIPARLFTIFART
jgi:transposase